MKIELVYLPTAEKDLRSIGKFHAEEVGSQSAREIYRNLRNEMNRLKEFPLLGQSHPDPILKAKGYRKLVLTRTYVAIYKVVDSTVYIYRIVNGRTDYPKLMK